MKSKHTAQSAPARRSRLLRRSICEGWVGEAGFFNLRLLIGVFIVVAGVFVALAGLGAFSALTASMARAQQSNNIIANSKDPLVPNEFDCSKIHELGIDKQLNFRAGAIMIACGQAQGGELREAPSSSAFSKLIQKLTAPMTYGGTDVDLITGDQNFPNVTQSETFTTGNPDNPDQIVVGYSDTRGIGVMPLNGSGASVSTDGGNTFTRLTTASGQSPFANTLGGAVILYNKPSGTWFTVWSGANGCPLNGYKSATPEDPNSWTNSCVDSNAQNDRQSGWADNNPKSPFYGRMYISWNDFSQGNANIFVTFSSDNGATWHSPIMASTGTNFIRNVQMTGDLVTGDVYIAGMDEGGGGFPHNDVNYFFRSTDGGNTWTNSYIGTPFPGPGVTAVGYFACMFPDNGGYWRYEGWGEPAAINGVVHYVYTQHGTGSDPGDVYYIRSTDRGETFSAPLKLNSDSSTRPNWQPNLSVSPSGTLFAVWYDARESTSCTLDAAVPCYRMWARKSTDNGVTWLSDDMFSDVVSPLPGQTEPGIIPDVGGFDYASAIAGKHLASWTDGRVAINGVSQQDAFFDQEPSAAVTPTPTPTPTATPTATIPPSPTPTATARATPVPRARPTPAPRP
ncbi:MAG TPA: sialidase family protein [Candidatus Udaeobacter sp.]|jgi:hypothetical protein|nr:sialidase family protein [Candidatus Udaeobacter sp.]